MSQLPNGGQLDQISMSVLIASTEPTRITSTKVEQQSEEVFYAVATELNGFQKCCLVLMYLVLLLLVTFIVYISCTWNKLRVNEYT
jgi:cell division protein FtsL